MDFSVQDYIFSIKSDRKIFWLCICMRCAEKEEDREVTALILIIEAYHILPMQAKGYSHYSTIYLLLSPF